MTSYPSSGERTFLGADLEWRFYSHLPNLLFHSFSSAGFGFQVPHTPTKKAITSGLVAFYVRDISAERFHRANTTRTHRVTKWYAAEWVEKMALTDWAITITWPKEKKKVKMIHSFLLVSLFTGCGASIASAEAEAFRDRMVYIIRIAGQETEIDDDIFWRTVMIQTSFFNRGVVFVA